MLIFRLQPDEGLLVKFNLKKPGKKNQLINKNLEFHYKNLSNEFNTNSYETLLLDIFNGDTMLFSRSDFVEMAWKIVDPISEEILKPIVEYITDPQIWYYTYPVILKSPMWTKLYNDKELLPLI